jgi:hypothetical protein
MPPLRVGYLFCRGVVDFGGRDGVYVLAVGESVGHCLVAGEVGHEAQLDLAVVGGEEQVAGVGDECAAYLAAYVVAHRYVLEVGAGGGYASCGRYGLVVVGVYLSCARVDGRREGGEIGREELL